MLSCILCARDLDLDLAPDTGECPDCGGPMVEFGEHPALDFSELKNTLKSLGLSLEIRPKLEKAGSN